MEYQKKPLSARKRVLIVSDGKRGHIHQTEGVVRKLHGVIGKKIEVKMSKSYYLFLVLMAFLSKRINFSRPLMLFWIQRTTKTSMEHLVKYLPDLIISAGSLTHPITFLLGKIWGAKTVICMRPSLLAPGNFDLVVAPRHDESRCRGDNIIYTMGATSHISEGFIFAEAVALYSRLKGDVKRPIGFLMGGNSSNNYINGDMAGRLCAEMLKACEVNNLNILGTTSRRTSAEAESTVSRELQGNPLCSYLVIASENPENPVPGIIGLCELVVVTEDSVSMVSEIITGGKYAIVVKVGRHSERNKFEKLFIDLMNENYITYTSIDGLSGVITELIQKKNLKIMPLDESRKVAQEIERRFFGGTAGNKGAVKE